MPKPKNIVIFSDGTGNTAIKGRGTNVFKLYEAVDLEGHKKNQNSTPQIAFYDDGVGTGRLRVWRVLSGAFGWGLGRNVRQLYADLARTYNPGDRIFLFGFSRGAFTVRTLADFIATCGIVDRRKKELTNDKELRDAVEECYKEYRRQYRTLLGGTRLGQRVRRAYSEERVSPFRLVDKQHAPSGKIPIEFIGVWDTVDAVGLPIAGLANLINSTVCPFKFPNYRLSPLVNCARHALAIDDERHTFYPLLWDETDEKDPDRIKQVWFAGVHSNVGGGYPKQGMSLVTLVWMMEEAKSAGLCFCDLDWQLYHERQNVYDKLYDSRSGLAFYYRYKPRDIGRICEARSVTPKIHVSAIERIIQGPEAYAPGNLPHTSNIVGRPDPAIPVAEVVQSMRAQLGESLSLLDRVKGWVFLRRSSHYVVLVLTVAVFLFTLGEEIARSGWDVLGTISSPVGLLKLAWAALRYAPWPVLAMVFFYALGLLASRRMRVTFSRFWYRVVR